MFVSLRKKLRQTVFTLPAGPSTLTHLDWPSIQSKAESAPSCHPRSSQQNKRQRYQDDQALFQSPDSSMSDSVDIQRGIKTTQAESSPKIDNSESSKFMSKIKKTLIIMNTSHFKFYTELKPTGSAASLFCFLERIPGLKATCCKVLQKLRAGSASSHYKMLKNLLQNLLIQFSQIRNFKVEITFQVIIQLLKTRVYLTLHKFNLKRLSIPQ